MAAFDYSFPDPSGAGDSLDGLDGSAIGLSGDPSSLDDFWSGSDLTAGGDPSGMGIWDLGENGDLYDSINLSGATESAPDPFSDNGVSVSGAGSAPGAANPYDSFSPSSFLSSAEKFGSVFTSLWANNPAPPTVAAGRPGYMNPNVSTPTMISKSHLLLIAVVVLVMVGIISFGDGVSA
jgi:hypothetical protein